LAATDWADAATPTRADRANKVINVLTVINVFLVHLFLGNSMPPMR
jgi:hypothetical protein